MTYASPGELPLVFPAPSADAPEDPRGVLIYNVAVHVYPSGHACTILGRIDVGNRSFVTENLGCYAHANQSRTSALHHLSDTVARALSRDRDEV